MPLLSSVDNTVRPSEFVVNCHRPFRSQHYGMKLSRPRGGPASYLSSDILVFKSKTALNNRRPTTGVICCRRTLYTFMQLNVFT